MKSQLGGVSPWITLASMAVLMMFAMGSGTAFASTISPAMNCADLAGLELPNTQIISGMKVAGPSADYCSIVGVINKRVSVQDPDHFTYGIGFQVNMPDNWIGRFEMQGGGGSDGSLGDPQGNFGQELAQGWAVASNDGGHQDVPGHPLLGWTDDDPMAGGTTHFGVDQQARLDYGYNGIEQTAKISKQIIEQYYGRGPKYSYLMGCSNGGRDAMVAAQRIPDMFDGLVAGNPGFNLPRAAVAEAWNEQQLAKLATSVDAFGLPYIPPTFPPQDLAVASAAIMKACDGLDGLVDGLVDNYTACTNAKVYPVLAEFTCNPNGAHGNVPHGGQCLTAGQVDVLKSIYAGPKNSLGVPLYSNWYWDAGIWDPPAAFGLGWAAWNVEFFGPPNTNTAANLTLGAGALPMLFMNPPVVTPQYGPNGQAAFMFNFNFDKDALKIYTASADYPRSAMDYMTGTPLGPSPLLYPFRWNGGKMIMYSSLNDGVFSGVDLVNYYETVDAVMGGHAADFARLFMVPNMAHCGGGPATANFSGEMLNAITSWVEKGVPPEKIIAANASMISPFPSSEPFDSRVAVNFPTGGTRPLCAYPKQTRYKGTGATNDAANFICVDPRHHGHGERP